MTLQVILSAPIPICPDNNAVYRLDGRSYRLMNGMASVLGTHLVNFGASPATVAGTIEGTAGAFVIEPGAAFMLGWVPQRTAWRALRMVGAQIPGPEGIPPDVRLHAMRLPGWAGDPSGGHPHLAPTPADAAFLVEALDGRTASAALVIIVEYLMGRLPALPGLQPSSAWSA